MSDSATFRLGDFIPSANGWNYSSDMLQVLSAASANTVAMYSYYGDWEGATDEDRGWYEVSEGEEPANDVEFPIGTAFLGNFAAKDVGATQSGAVLSGATALDYTGSQYVMLGNPLPKSITLGDIVPSTRGWNYSSDMLQVLSTSSANTTAMYSYYGDWEGATDEDRGWYEVSEGEEPSDSVSITPGDAWLGNFAAKDVVLVFPPAVE